MSPPLLNRAHRAVRRVVREIGVRHRIRYANVIHCCVQKTASRWVRRLLSDPRVYKYSGASIYDYEKESGDPVPGRLSRDLSAVSFPHKRIITPLYVDYPTFASIPDLDERRGFMVIRDPRDILVSWYFSMKVSHVAMGGRLLEGIRSELQGLGKEDGFCHAIWALDTRAGMWDALRTWAEADDRRVMVVKYRDLTSPSDGPGTFKKVLEHCDVPLPMNDVVALYEDHSFEKLAGRERGNEDQQAHLRKGVVGDWENHFTERVMDKLRETTGDLVEALGYE